MPDPAGGAGAPPRTSLAILLLASTLGVMAGAIVMPVLELIRRDLAVSGTAAGLIMTSHGLAIAVSSPLIGRLIDRVGVRGPMAAGLIIYGFAGGAGTVTNSYPALIASRLLLGIGAAAVFTGTTVAMLALYHGRQRDVVMGWRTTATTVGGLIWPLLAGLLGAIHWHATFSIYLIGVPLGIVSLLVIPATRPATTEPGNGGHRGAVQLLRRHPTLLSWYGLLALAGIMLYTLAVFLPQRLAQIGVEDPRYLSLFMVVNAIAASVIGLSYAKLRDRFNYDVLLRATGACWLAAFLILGTVNTPIALFTAAALFGAGNGLLLPVITVLIGDTPPPAQRAQATALSGTAMFIGQFCSPLVFGPLMAATSITTGYLAAAGISAAILATLLRVRISPPTPTNTSSLTPESARTSPDG